MKAYLEQMGILNPKAVYRNLAPLSLLNMHSKEAKASFAAPVHLLSTPENTRVVPPMIVSSLMNLPCIILLTGAR